MDAAVGVAMGAGRERAPGSVPWSQGRSTLELMAFFRRSGVVLLATSLALLLVGGATAHGSTADDLDAARSKLAQARAAATAAAGDYAQAESKEATIDTKITGLETAIAAGKARAATLQGIARDRAVYAYTHSHQSLDLVVSSDDPVTALRRQQLRDHANQTDDGAVRKLAALTADLHDKEAALKKQREEAEVVKAQLLAQNQDLQVKLAAAQQAAADLQAKLDTEIAAAVEAAVKVKLEAERAALAASRPVTVADGGGAGQIVANPVGGHFMCPVAGAAFTDDYGGPRGHPGIDMFVPTGTPAVAVEAGSVTYMADDGAGGNEAYLDAEDGNTYYYAHFSAFSGGARDVKQGEVLGLTGMTGNASAPHLHFEIRIGGPNGSRIDPYPTLKAAGC